jgi:hypothetical protein
MDEEHVQMVLPVTKNVRDREAAKAIYLAQRAAETDASKLSFNDSIDFSQL